VTAILKRNTGKWDDRVRGHWRCVKWLQLCAVWNANSYTSVIMKRGAVIVLGRI